MWRSNGMCLCFSYRFVCSFMCYSYRGFGTNRPKRFLVRIKREGRKIEEMNNKTSWRYRLLSVGDHRLWNIYCIFFAICSKTIGGNSLQWSASVVRDLFGFTALKSIRGPTKSDPDRRIISKYTESSTFV